MSELSSRPAQGGGAQGLVSRPVQVAFALGAAATAACNQIVVVLLIRFLTDNLAMSAALAALLFAVTKVYDGIVDPLVGYASDRTSTRWGRRLPYLLAAGILMPLSILGLFAPPIHQSGWVLTAWVGFMLLVHGTAYSLYTVPSGAMSVEVTDGYHDRSVLMTVKMYGFFAGQIIGSSLPPWLLAAWGGGREGHAGMAMVLAAIVGLMALVSVPLLRGARATRDARKSGGTAKGLFGQLGIAWGNRPFRVMVMVHVVFMVGTATASSSNAYFTRYVLQRTDAWLGAFYIFLTLGNWLAMPAWLWLSRRIDKKATYVTALLLYGLGVLSWMVAGPADPLWLLGLRVTLIGAAMSGVILLAQSMLTDAVRYDYVVHGLRREGAFTGIMSLVDKLSSAAGLVAMGSLLSAMGYAGGRGGAAVLANPEALTGIYWCFSLIPALMAFGAVLMLRGYRLTEADLAEPGEIGPGETGPVAHAAEPGAATVAPAQVLAL
ncbi:MAG TPA: MFS transporter [Novosphingobium sp.]|nr:MFS transporter [Novosphingobium sp.]